MTGTLDQFIAFTTDAFGIERTLRLVQGLAQVFASSALPFELLLTFATQCTGREQSPEVTLAILLALKSRMNLARRFFRLFRFAESFRDAQRLYTSVQRHDQPSSADAWLDIFSRTFNGMYLLLEASTIIDVLDIERLTVWDRATRTSINVEAQRFWLFSLVCGALAGLWKMFCIMAYAPVPQAVSVDKLTADNGVASSDEKSKKQLNDEQDEKDDDPAAALKKEQARLRQTVQDRKTHARQTRDKIYKLGRGVAANAFDVAIPGTVVGWLKLDEATVGSAMVVSTVLTGLAVWERCGQQQA